MFDAKNLNKLRKRIRQEGILTATGAVANHMRRTLASTVEGLPGHYHLRHRQLERRYPPEDITPRWISPDEITHLTGPYERRERGHLDYVPYFKPREASWGHLSYERELPYGTTVGGEWDRTRHDFSRLFMYQGVKQRFIEERSWEETIYYEKLHTRFRDAGWNDENAQRLARDRCDDIEAVYGTIRDEGYRSQRDLNGHPLHEVTVNVARDGEFLYNCEGRHRLSVAKALDIEEIPVLVLATHADYVGEPESR